MEHVDKLFISYPSEPFQQAVVWPTTYTQPQTTIQSTPHLLMPPITAAQTMQPPPLAPLLLSASDYLSAGTTLHQVHFHSKREKIIAVQTDPWKKSNENNIIFFWFF